MNTIFSTLTKVPVRKPTNPNMNMNRFFPIFSLGCNMSEKRKRDKERGVV